MNVGHPPTRRTREHDDDAVCRTPWKIRYASRREAIQAHRQARPQLRHSLRPYHCECGFWHLSHMSRRAAKQSRARKAAA